MKFFRAFLSLSSRCWFSRNFLNALVNPLNGNSSPESIRFSALISFSILSNCSQRSHKYGQPLYLVSVIFHIHRVVFSHGYFVNEVLDSLLIVKGASKKIVIKEINKLYFISDIHRHFHQIIGQTILKVTF